MFLYALYGFDLNLIVSILGWTGYDCFLRNMKGKKPKSAKKKQVTVQQRQNYLFEDLIIDEILTRLPVKSVIRFKSVSKHWYSTLSSPKFARDYLIKSPFPHPSAPVDTLLIQTLNNYYIFSYDDDEGDDQIPVDVKHLVKLDIDFGSEPGLIELDIIDPGVIELIGCCNGLICLTESDGYSYFILWNPATGKLHKYGSGEVSKIFDDEQLPFVGGFGYASDVDDYKYVQILTLYRATVVGSDTRNIFRIFSLRENKWKIIDYDYDTDMLFPYGKAVLINEKLYWACTKTIGPLRPETHVVVSFDLRTDKFDIIEFINDRNEYLGVMGGCLSKYKVDRRSLEGDELIQILESESPVVVKPIRLPNRVRLDESSEVIGFTRTGKFFVTGPLPLNDDQVEDYDSMLGIVDRRMKPMRYTKLLLFDGAVSIARYVPSLVSPSSHGGLDA